jgi:hypothetical protein
MLVSRGPIQQVNPETHLDPAAQVAHAGIAEDVGVGLIVAVTGIAAQPDPSFGSNPNCLQVYLFEVNGMVLTSPGPIQQVKPGPQGVEPSVQLFQAGMIKAFEEFLDEWEGVMGKKRIAKMIKIATSADKAYL